MTFTLTDTLLMARALQLAEQGLFTTTPNPRVGCVLVKNGEVIGEGWHEHAGGPHAEINALTAAKQAGHSTNGATAYVTLEPCNHFGRTPPCVDALIEAGIVHVIAAMQDPNPQVSGEGLDKLNAAGIRVTCGLREGEATELNIGFISRMTRNRPWVRLKVAASLDGMTALNNGTSQWITGPEARRDAHAWRARSCAILTGYGTVKMDNPQLTVREVDTPRQPLKVVVDSKLRISPDARIAEGNGLLVATAVMDETRASALRQRGIEILTLPDASGKVDLLALLKTLALRGINEVHVEAGHRLNGALLAEGLVDEFLIYQAPVLLGDLARGMFALPELTTLTDARRLNVLERRFLGEDQFIRARPG
ncbi:MAG: bifunctional diaminohydroxyphosphoribosylaminopyrimidine deaminase/5-amino-6-(5-phosphoribosylamino)uracil reductase RibD [Rhodocyclaceae bacterium]|nr:bifunctional diaminohydroxyphosphoribosylaminopyrimidine deaminase/5-amino-6-(5-phosphoribosylamino)uracil reductase RibD [Rhodocyclaceae bacterium]